MAVYYFFLYNHSFMHRMMTLSIFFQFIYNSVSIDLLGVTPHLTFDLEDDIFVGSTSIIVGYDEENP